jgi:hypothetical protein
MLLENGMKKILKQTPAAWIAIYSAIIGVSSLVPIFPYSGGGGYAPLSISFIVMAPFLLGFGGGIISAFIGGIIGMFIAPGAFPMGFFDVIFIAVLLSSFVALAINGDVKKYRWVFIFIYLFSGILFEIIPYYLPGKSSGFMPPLQPIYTLITTFFWVPWLIIYVLPFGGKYIPSWAKQNKNIKLRYFGVLIASITGLMCWGIFYNLPYFLLLNIPNELAIATLIQAMIFLPIFAIIATSFTILTVRYLEKLGYPSPIGAIWNPSNK